MTVSMNGMRRNATSSMNNLAQTIKEIIENNDLYEHEKEELIEKFNQAAQSVDSFNYLYDDKIEGDFDCLDIEIERLKDSGES